MVLRVITASERKRLKRTFLWLFIATIALGDASWNPPLSRGADDDGSSPKVLGPRGLRAGEDISGELIARYLVTFMKSRTTDPLRTATVVTVTNEANQSCQITVDWIRGFETTPASRTNLSLEGGFTGDFCSRDIPPPLTTCNATSDPELTFHEGHAVVSSSVAAGCERLGVSARVYYTQGDNDGDLLAISDPKIVPTGKGN